MILVISEEIEKNSHFMDGGMHGGNVYEECGKIFETFIKKVL